MSSLTEEQRKRIEENRRKALERRAQKSNSQTTLVSAQNTTGTNFENSSVSSTALSNNGPSSASFFTFLNSSSDLDKSAKPNATLSKISYSGDIIRGHCYLLSRSRFYVDVGYQKEIIDIFKSVPSRLYDMKTKRWNFDIEDHDKLIAAVKPLQPEVLIIPLPRMLLKLFSNVKNNVPEEFDLSVLDPVLLKALLPFQREGVNFGIRHEGRLLLADDMGLGKTIQAIAIASYFKEDWPLLVVTPSSVRYSWLEAFHLWLPSVSQYEISIINSGKDHVPNDKVVILSYDLLTKLQDPIMKKKFRSIIFDESHFLKNYKSARTKAALNIAKNMKRVIMLSGTPALSRPAELFTQISTIRPRYFSNFKEYGMRYCDGKKMPWNKFMDFSGSSNMEELQVVLEEVLMIRRLKSDVIKQLPSKCRQIVILDPSRISKSKLLVAMGARMQQENLSGMERRGALLEYFHETGAVKTPAVCEYIDDLLESDRKFLCFAHHKNVIESICRMIDQKRIDYICIDGSVSAEQRKKLCDHFQKNDACKVAVLSITSANYGITLTSASLVVFAELFWNPGILTQAEDRAHRIGQEDSVLVQYLIAKHTADDEIWPLVQKKLDILNKAGLSKDNFSTADTVVKDDSTQPHLEDFWAGMENTDISEIEDEIPGKRLKLDL